MPAVERKLAAILATDVLGYSRLMGADDESPISDGSPGSVSKSNSTGVPSMSSSAVSSPFCRKPAASETPCNDPLTCMLKVTPTGLVEAPVMSKNPLRSPSLPGTLTPARTVPSAGILTEAEAPTELFEASACAVPWAKVTIALALISVPVPLLPSNTSSPRLLNAWVVAEVASGSSNEADPEAGVIVRWEIVSELSTIASANAAWPGRASTSAIRYARVSRWIAVRMVTNLPVPGL
jgi:hypothetical protein